MGFTKKQLELILKLVKCERCQMSDATVLPSYKAQLTKLHLKIKEMLKEG